MNKQLIKRDFWDTFPPFFRTKDLFNGINNDFEKILNGKCDFEEYEDKYVIELEVPGVKKDEINLNFKNEIITISWHSKKENKIQKEKSRYERSEGSFTKKFDVEGSDPKKIEAELKKGILKIVLPKLEISKPKMIQIN